MHGDLNRISIDQSLDALRLVSVGQLVCRVYVDLDLSAGCFFPLHDASVRTDKAIRAILTDVFIFVFFSLINYLS